MAINTEEQSKEGNPITNDSTTNSAEDNILEQEPLDLTRDDQTVVEDGQVKGIGFLSLKFLGVPEKTMALSDQSPAIYMENEDDAKALFEEAGLEPELFEDLYSGFLKDYSILKSGYYNDNTPSIKSGTTTDFTEGVTQLEKVEASMYLRYFSPTMPAARVANKEDFVDISKFKRWDKDNEEFIESEMGAFENITTSDLVIQQDYDVFGKEKGIPYYRELKPGEDWWQFEARGDIASNSNYKDIYQRDGMIGAAAQFASGVLISGVAQVVGELGYMGTIFKEWSTDKMFGKDDSLLKTLYTGGDDSTFFGAEKSDWLDIIKWSSSNQYHMSEEYAHGGFTGSAGSFAYNFAKTFGEFIPQLAAGYLTAGASLELSVLTAGGQAMAKEILLSGTLSASKKIVIKESLVLARKKAKGTVLTTAENELIFNAEKIILASTTKGAIIKGATDVAVRKSLRKHAMKKAQGFMIIGAAQATGNNMYSLKTNGIDDRTAMGVSLALSPIMYATERLVGTGWLMSKYGMTARNVGIRKAISEFDKDILNNASKEAAETVVGNTVKKGKGRLSSIIGLEGVKKAFTREYIQNIAKATGESYSAVKKRVAKSISSNNVRVASPGRFTAKFFNKIDEFEMAFDEMKILKGNDGFSKLFQGRGNPLSFLKGAGREGTQEALEQIGYIGGYWAHDNYLAKSGATKGRGAMGYFSLRDDILNKRTYRELRENFIGGFAVGGFAAGIMRNGGSLYNQLPIFDAAAQAGETEDVVVDYASIHALNPEAFGPVDLQPDLKVMSKNGTDKSWITVDKDYPSAGLKKGQEIKSLSDFNYYNSIKELYSARDIFHMTGLSPNSLSRFRGAESVYYRGIVAFRLLQENKNALASAKEELKSDGITDEQKIELQKTIAEYTTSVEELTKHYNYLMADDGSGFSEGFKDSRKNAAATLELANIAAAEEMGLNEKYKGVPPEKFSEREVNDFIKRRSKVIDKTENINIYNEAKNVYKSLKNWALKNKVVNDRKLIKDYEEQAKKNNDDSKKLADSMTSLLKEVNSSNKISDNSIIFKKLNGLLTSFQELASSSASNEIIETFSSFENEARQIFESIETDPLGSYSNEKTFIPQYSENKEIDHYLESKTALKEGDERFDDAISEEELAQGLFSNPLMESNIEKIKINFAEYEQAKKDAESYGYGLDVDEKNLEEAAERLVDKIYLDPLTSMIDFIKRGQDDKWSNVPDLQKLINSAKEQLKEAEMLKNSLRLRGFVFPSFALDEDRARLLDKQDIPMERTVAREMISEIETQEAQLQALIDEASSVLGLRSDVFIKNQHEEAIMNILALKTISDNDNIAKELGSEITSKIEKLTIFPISEKDYNDENKAEIHKVEKQIFEVFDLISEKKDIFTDQALMSDLLHNTFLEKVLYEKKMTGRFYNTTEVYKYNQKTDERVKLTSALLDIAYGYYNNSTATNENNLAYVHFINTLVALGSGLKVSELAAVRLSYYGGEKIASSTEQIKAENEIITFINGGHKVLDVVNKIETARLNEVIESDSDERQKDSDVNFYTSRIGFLSGDVQTGKSVQMIPQIIKAISQLGSKERFVLVAHSKETLSAFNKIAADLINSGFIEGGRITTLSSSEALKNKYNKDYVKDALIFMDEATLFSDSQLATLEKSFLANENTHLVYVGDSSQMPSYIGVGAQARSNVRYKGFKTTPVNKKFATHNPLLADLMSFLKKEAAFFNDAEYPKAYHEVSEGIKYKNSLGEEVLIPKGRLLGVEYISSVYDIVEKGIKRINSNEISAKELTIVFLTEDHYKDYIKANPSHGKILEANKSFVTVLSNDNTVALKDLNFDSIQGARRNEVFIAFDGSKETFLKYVKKGLAQASGLNKQALYTLVGRSIDYVGMIGNPNNKYTERPAVFVSSAESINQDENNAVVIKYLTEVMNGNVSAQSKETNNDIDNDIFVNDIQKEAYAKLKNLHEESKDFVTDGNSKVYTRTSTSTKSKPDEYDRVSSILGPGGVPFSLISQFKNDMAKKLTKAGSYGHSKGASIGTAFDDIFRHVLNPANKIKRTDAISTLWEKFKALTYMDGETSNPLFDNSNEGPSAAFIAYINNLLDFNDELISRGEVPFSLEIVLHEDQTKKAGTPDLITVDENGQYRVYDLKTKFSSNLYYLTHDSKFIYSEDIAGGRTELEGYGQQVSTYSYLLGLQTGITHTQVASIKDGGTILVQSVEYDKENKYGVETVKEFIEHNVPYVETNIIKESQSKKRKQPPLVEVSSFTPAGGVVISVGDFYENTNGNEVEIIKIIKTGNNHKIYTTADPEGIFYTVFKNKYSKVINNEILVDQEEIEELLTDNGQVVINKRAARSARIFKRTGAVYSNPVTIPLTNDEFDSTGIDNTTDNLEKIKTIKSYFANHLEGKIEFKEKFNYIDDNGKEQISHNGLFVISNKTASELIGLSKGIIDTELRLLVNKLIASKSGVQLLNTIAVIGLPKTFDGINWVAAENYATDYLSYINDLKKVRNDVDEIHKDIVDYNISLFSLFGNFKEGKAVSITVKQSPSDIQGTLVKTSELNTISKLRNTLSKKGIKLGFSDDINFYEVNGNNDKKNHIVVLPFAEGGVLRKENNANILLLTPTINGSLSTEFGQFVQSQIELELSQLRSGNNISIYRSSIHSFIATNLKTFFSDSVINQKIPGTNTTFGNVIFQNKGKVKFHKKYIKDTDAYLKEDRENMIVIGDFLLLAMNNPSILSVELKGIRLPYNKALNDSKGTEQLENMLTNVNDIYHRPVFFNVAPVLAQINKPASTSQSAFGFGRPSINESDREYDAMHKFRAKELVGNILGNKYSDEWLGFTRKEVYDEVSVFGYMQSGKIKLVEKKSKVNRHTVRHEIFHVIDDYFLGEDSKAKIYNIVRNNIKGYEEASIDEIKEFLADWYGTFGQIYQNLENIDEEYLAKYRNLLDKVKDRYLMFEGELADLFTKIESGYYNDAAERLESLDVMIEIKRLAVRNVKPWRHKNNALSEELKEKGYKDKSEINRMIKKLKSDYQKLKEDDHIDNAYEALIEAFVDDAGIEMASSDFLRNFTFQTTLYGGDYSLEDYIKAFTRPSTEFKGRESLDENIINAKLKINDKNVKITDVTKEQFALLSDEDKSIYVEYHTKMNYRIAQGFVKIHFPSYNIKRGQLGTKKKFGFGDNYSVDDSISDKMNWVLSTFAITEPDGTEIKYTDAANEIQSYRIDHVFGYFQDKSETVAIMKEAAGRANTILLNPNNINLDFVDAFKEALIVMMPKMDSPMKTKIYTVYKRFFDGYNIEEAKRDIPSLINGINGTDNFIKDSVNSLLTQYSNIIVIQPFRYKVDYDNSKITALNPTTQASFKQSIKDGMISSLYASGVIKGIVRNAFDKKSKMRVNKDEEKIDLIRFTDDNNLMLSENKILNSVNGHYEFSSPERMISQAMLLSNHTGLNMLSRKLIDRFLSYRNIPLRTLNVFDTSKIKGSENLTPDQFFATILGNFSELIILNIKMEDAINNITESYDKNDKSREWITNPIIKERYHLDINEALNKLKPSSNLNEFMKNINFNTKNLDGIIQSTNFDSEVVTINDIKIIGPANFYTYVEALAEIMYQQTGSFAFSQYYLADKAIYAFELNNAINRTFPNSLQNSDYSDIGATPNLFDQKFDQTINEGNVKKSIFFDEKGKSRSPFISDKVLEYSPEGIVKISRSGSTHGASEMTPIQVRSIHGLETDYANTTNIKGVDRGRMYLDLYLNYLMKNDSKTNILLPFGHTSREEFLHLTFADPNLIDFVKIKLNNNDKISSFEFNPESLLSSIQKKFEYNKALSKDSYNRWNEFIFNDESFQNDDILGSLFGDSEVIPYESLESFNFAGGYIIETEAEYNRILNSDMYLGSDYHVNPNEDGSYTLMIGETLLQNNKKSPFNYTNHRALADAGLIDNEITGKSVPTSSKAIRDVLGSIFDNFIAVNNELYKSYLGEDVNGVLDFFNEYADSKGYKDGKSILSRKNEKGEYLYNPIFQSLYYAYAIMGGAYQDLIAGPTSQYSDVFNYDKRFEINKTPKSNLRLNVHKGVGSKMKYIAYLDESLNLGDEVEGFDDMKIGNESIEEFDGGSIGFIAAELMIRNTYGNDSSPYDKTIYKPAYTNINPSTGIKEVQKYATDFTSESMLDHNPTLKNIQLQFLSLWSNNVKKLFGINIQEQFNQYYKGKNDGKTYNGVLNFTESLDKILDDIENIESSLYQDAGLSIGIIDDVNKLKDAIKSEVIFAKVPHTSIKTGARRISRKNDAIEDIRLNTIDSKDWGIISNYGSDFSANASVANPNQAIAHVGVGNPSIADSIAKSLSYIVNSGVQEMYDAIGINLDYDNWTSEDIVKIQNYLVTLGISSTANSKANLSLNVGLRNGVSIEPIQIVRQLEQFWTSRMNGAVRPRMKGTRMIQAPGVYIDLYINEAGLTYNYKTMQEFGFADETGMITSLGVANGFVKTKLKPMHFDNADIFHYSDIAASYVHASTFGIMEGEQVEDGFKIILGNGSVLDLRSLLSNLDNESDLNLKMAVVTDYLTKSLSDESLYIPDEVGARVPYLRKSYLAEDKAENNIVPVDEYIIKELAVYLVNYDKSLEMVDTRVPFDTPALGFVGKIRQFVWGNGAVIYFSPLENIRTGGDFDIDELSTYFYDFVDAFTAPDINIEGEEVAWHKNNIIEQIKSFYMNPNNKTRIYNVTGTREIKKAIEGHELDLYHNSLASLIEIKDMTTVGGNAIPIFALATSANAYLEQMTRSDDLEKSLNLMGFLQAALDNGVYPIIAHFGFPEEMVPILEGLSFNGLSYTEILELQDKYAVKDIIYSVKKGSSVLKKKADLIEILKVVSDDYTEKGINSAKNLYNLIQSFESYYEFDTVQLYKDLSNPNDIIREVAKTIIYRIKKRVLSANNAGSLDGTGQKLEESNVDPEKLKKEKGAFSNLLKDFNNIIHHYDNRKAIRQIEEAYVSSSALYKFSSIIGLRNGIPGDHVKKILKKNTIEDALSTSMEEFLNGVIPSEEEIIQYYKRTNNSFRAMNEEFQPYALELQRKIHNEINIAAMIQSNEYFVELVNIFNLDYKTSSSMAMVNNEKWDYYRNYVANKQNRNRLEYASQYRAADRIVSELLLGEFFKVMNINVNVAVPFSSSKGFRIKDDFLMNLNPANIKDGQIYKNNFPVLIRRIQQLVKEDSPQKIIKFFNAIGVQMTVADANNIINSEFLYSIRIKNDQGFEAIEINNTFVYDTETVYRVRNDFRKMPKDFQFMFELYDAINSKFRYSTRGLSSIITDTLKIEMDRSIKRGDLKLDQVIDDFFKKGNNFEQFVEYFLLDNSVRRTLDKNDPATATTKKVTRGAYKINLPFINTGLVNNDDNKETRVIFGAKYHQGYINTDGENFIIKGVPSIKLGTENYKILNQITKILNNGKIISVTPEVNIKTLIEHGYKNGVHKTEFGELVSVKVTGVTSIKVTRLDTKLTLDEAEAMYISIAKDAGSFVNFAKPIQELLEDGNVFYKVYLTEKGWKNSSFNYIEGLPSDVHVKYLLHTKENNYKITADYLGFLSNVELSDRALIDEVVDLPKSIGVSYYEDVNKSRAHVMKEYLKGQKIFEGINGVYVVKFKVEGKLRDTEAMQAEITRRINKDQINCK